LPHLFVITGGLKADDKILLEGLRKVKNNEEIDYEFVSPKTVITQLGLYSE
jgi:membrane fusion protein (multidrug efflux system)